jgi:hypothetical protein
MKIQVFYTSICTQGTEGSTSDEQEGLEADIQITNKERPRVY